MTGKIAFQGELGAYSHEACQEARADMTPLPCRSFEDVIEEMIAEYGDTDGYQFLYMIAHELSRQANALRSKANYIEDSTNAVGRLFDLD